MAAPRHETVNDLQELLALTKAVGTASATNLLWFRGVSDATHTLLPGLYRGGDPANVLVAKENLMRSQFASRSMPLLESTQQNEWGFLFIMQHYGAPTRLLDWTENAFLGLYFALSVAARKGFVNDAAVWLLDPAAWNTGVLPGMDPPGSALDAENPDLNNYLPGREINSMANDVVAMYARYNNPRITAQRGVFTVFGREKRPMEDVFDRNGLGDDVLIKAVLPRAVLSMMNDDLRILGFRESMIYPDLAGLAKEIAIDQGLSS
jgi:hypothetical protein